MTLFFSKKMDTVTLLLDRDQANSQDFRNRIQRFRGQIQHLVSVERDHVEHIRKLSIEFHHETTTPKRRAAILREDTRTRRGIALIREMINFHEEDIRLEEENQRRRRGEIVNIVNRFLHHRDVQ